MSVRCCLCVRAVMSRLRVAFHFSTAVVLYQHFLQIFGLCFFRSSSWHLVIRLTAFFALLRSLYTFFLWLALSFICAFFVCAIHPYVNIFIYFFDNGTKYVLFWRWAPGVCSPSWWQGFSVGAQFYALPSRFPRAPLRPHCKLSETFCMLSSYIYFLSFTLLFLFPGQKNSVSSFIFLLRILPNYFVLNS